MTLNFTYDHSRTCQKLKQKTKHLKKTDDGGERSKINPLQALLACLYCFSEAPIRPR